jgi:hypothetical protein
MFMTVSQAAGLRGVPGLSRSDRLMREWYPGLGTSTDWGTVGAGAASGAATGAPAGPYGAAAGAIVGGAAAYFGGSGGLEIEEDPGRGFAGRLKKFEKALGVTRGKGEGSRPVDFRDAVAWALRQGVPRQKIAEVIQQYPEAMGAGAMQLLSEPTLADAGSGGGFASAAFGGGGGSLLPIVAGIAVLGLVMSKRK